MDFYMKNELVWLYNNSNNDFIGTGGFEGAQAANKEAEEWNKRFEKLIASLENENMDFYIEKYKSELIKNEVLSARNNELIERDEWLTCLEEAGVDNWSGIDLANEIKEESY